MGSLSSLLDAFSVVLQPEYLLYAFIGALVGTAVGVLPGLGPTVTMALLLPVVFALGDPTGAIIMFAGIFYGAMYGGSTAAILLSTPGESSSVVTALDGYRMTKAGRGGAALLSAAVGSFVAGIIATLALALVAKPIGAVAITFGPPEMVAFAVLALSTAAILGGRPSKAAVSALFGIAIGTVGIHSSSGVARLSFDVLAVYDGINFELVTIGTFAIVEVLFVVGMYRTRTIRGVKMVGKLWMTAQEWRRSVGPWLRGSVLGFLVGVLPGAGATMSSYLSYGLERNISKTPEKFGRGEGLIEGLAGPEAANNAATGGALVPLLTLGIPAGAATAMMVGALQGLGVKTGPLLFRENPDFVWAIIASLFIGNVMLIVLNVPLIQVWVKMLSVPTALLMPMILVISTVGVFSLTRNRIDLILLLIFGVIGLLLRSADIPLAPLVLGLVLGPLIEEQANRALTTSQGDWAVFVSGPVPLGVLILAVLIITVPLWRKIPGLLRRLRTGFSQ